MIPLQEKIPSTNPALSGLTAGGSFAEFKSPSGNLANIQKDYSWLLKKFICRG